MTGQASARREGPSSPTPLHLAWRRYRRSRPGVIAAWVLGALYLMALLSPFLAPYNITTQHEGFEYQRPQVVRIVHEGRLTRPFVYGSRTERDPVTFAKKTVPDTTQPLPLKLFVKAEPYSFFGFRADRHLFGVAPGQNEYGEPTPRYFFPFGTDQLGRDLFSRTLVGAQVSMTVGLVGVLISFTLGILLGGVSGYFGGWVDSLIQRVVEVLLSFPRLPILLALATLIPARWPSTWVYTGIVAVLALIGWASLARVVRGQVLAARNLDYVSAAQAMGASNLRVILRHITPNLSSFLLVTATLALPGYILGESTLSFLGLGIKEPMTSWGLLLRDASKLEVVSSYPWLLWPGLFVFISVLAFNFMGDALRDAADTQSR